MEAGDDRAEVGVPAPLPVAVDRPLDLCRPALHRRQGGGHCHLGVVMGMNSERKMGCFPDLATTRPTSEGSDPPLVPQKPSQSAPPSAAAASAFSAYLGLRR